MKYSFDIELPFEPKVLAHSKSHAGEVFSVLLPINKELLAELRTHRVLSQAQGEIISTELNDINLSVNANSSRAIPVSKQIDMAMTKPYMPHWSGKKKGMQGELNLSQDLIDEADAVWLKMRDEIIDRVEELESIGIHKQEASRPLSAFTWATVIVTADASAWQLFFDLRCPMYQHSVTTFRSRQEAFEFSNLNIPNSSYAAPGIQVIAERVYDLYRESRPKYLNPGEWHIVFDDTSLALDARLYTSMSKCAKISYDNQDKPEELSKHIDRATRLIQAKHWSTAEHQLCVPTKQGLFSDDFKEYWTSNDGRSVLKRGKYVSNIKGWMRLREMIQHDNYLSN